MDIQKITHGPLTSPAQLIDLQEELFPVPDPAPLAPPISVTRWAFRGQSQSYGTLVPSFQRIFGAKRSAGTAEIIELDLLKTFRDHYAQIEGRTFDMPHPDLIKPGYDLRCLSVMQHYGVPTRLLDWTGDFWTAVYFACAGDPAKEAELWIYDRAIFSGQQSGNEFRELVQPTGPGYPPPQLEPRFLGQRGTNWILELDPQISPRMKKQFAHHTLSTDVFADHAPLLFDMAAPVDSVADRFRRVLIEPSCKTNALKFLANNLKITAGSIFPDVEGLGKFLHWHLESLVTTLL